MPENINKIEENIRPAENTVESGGVKAELSAGADFKPLTDVGEKLAHDEQVTAGDLTNLTETLEKAKEQTKVDIGGKEISMTEYRELVEKNKPIWEEIKRGKYENHERLTFLIPSVAAELANFKGNHLSLDGLTTITPGVATELTKSKATYLYFSGLTTLTPEVAAELAKYEGNWLCLNRLTSLTPEVATELAKYRGARLYLDGLTTLSLEAATELAKFNDGVLFYLDSLDRPSRDLYNQARAVYKAEQEKNKK